MNPDEAILFKNRADAAFMLGATEQAVKDYFKALELDSSDERIRQSCASIFFERGDALYARGEFMEAIYQITDVGFVHLFIIFSLVKNKINIINYLFSRQSRFIQLRTLILHEDDVI